MSLDPRVDDLFRELEKVKKAIQLLTGYVDAAIWRVSTEEERRAGITIREELKKILEQ